MSRWLAMVALLLCGCEGRVTFRSEPTPEPPRRLPVAVDSVWNLATTTDTAYFEQFMWVRRNRITVTKRIEPTVTSGTYVNVTMDTLWGVDQWERIR